MSLTRALGASMAAAALAAAAVAAPAGANVQVGSSGWEWGNPLPQGNTLRAMTFAGSTGYAAGDFGTLLKTTDGGATWTGLRVATLAGLRIVQALDGETVFAGGGCVARRSTDGGRTFTAVSFTPVESSCRAELADLSFVSADTGFLLLADGSVFATTDGGTQFTPRTAVPGTQAAGGSAGPASLGFTSPTRGFAATRDGRIFVTTDGGVSWRVAAETGRAIAQLAFPSASRGYAVGQGGLFARSDDGGATWRALDLGAGALDYTAIRCASEQLCLLSTASGAQLVRTGDGGETPASVITPSTDPILAAAFASPSRVAAVGANGATVVSDDAGATFAPIGGRLTGSYSGVRAGARAGTAYATGATGALAKTTDGGRTWERGNVPTTAEVRDVSFPSPAIGYALDADGGLFRTANAGATWKTLGTGSAARPAAIHAPSGAVALAVGPRGVRRSDDGGETFSPVRSRAVASAALTGVHAGRGTVVVWGPKALARSRDGGRTWQALGRPGETRRARARLRIAQAAFSSPLTGLVRDATGTLWRTTDGGRRWASLPAVGTDAIADIAVDGDRTAYAVLSGAGGGGAGTVLRTTNGGTTWQKQLVVSQTVTDVATSSGPTDYLLGGQTQLLASTTGGLAGRPSRLTISTRRTRLARPGRVTVTGRLRPSGPAARVTVSALQPSGRWLAQTVDVASNGTFASSWRVAAGTTRFVAQWAGDFAAAGAGSTALAVTTRPVRRAPARARGRARGRGRGRRDAGRGRHRSGARGGGRARRRR